MYVYIYIYSSSYYYTITVYIYIYIFIHIYVCVYVYISIYIYIYMTHIKDIENTKDDMTELLEMRNEALHTINTLNKTSDSLRGSSVKLGTIQRRLA